jgi:hypothetical protein
MDSSPAKRILDDQLQALDLDQARHIHGARYGVPTNDREP